MSNPVSKKGKIITIEVVDRLKRDLVAEGLVPKKKLSIATLTAQRENETLSNALIKLGFVTEEQLVRFIGEKMHIPYIDIN